MENNKKIYALLYPIFLALTLIGGIWLGIKISGSQNSFVLSENKRIGGDKISNIIDIINETYVDSVKKDKLVDKAINSILQNLDPHSYYITASEMAEFTEPLEGNFDGIGVEFLIQNDTVFVVSSIEGGPSQKLGIQAGDKIISADGTQISGKGITNDKVMHLLRGKSGSEVKVEIKRGKSNKLLNFIIERGEIPIYSLQTAQMVDNGVGYVKISRFAKTTYEEFKAGADKLLSQGMTKMILDLRGNGGGYLNSAIAICEEFLNKNTLIVYTQGNSQPKRVYTSSKTGELINIELVVLVNEGSASASEIVAGAIQDNDRGIIIGRRTFGKGLVQEHIDLKDSTAIRLTVARYYTPTGRCIQKPYGNGINYEEDYSERFDHGELLSKDSIKHDSLQFKTPKGKIVFGGGGIIPDVFVPIDTLGASYFLSELLYTGTLQQFSFGYANENRESIKKTYISAVNFKKNFNVSEDYFEKLKKFSADRGIIYNAKEIEKSSSIIAARIKADISKNIWGDDSYYSITLEDDNDFKEAMEKL
jgi:carboxyl-terminal processing protease